MLFRSANAIKAVDYFTTLRNKGVPIVATNNSWGGGGYSQGLYDAIERANQADILFIAAAGNGGTDGVGDNNDSTANYPSNYSTLSSVGWEAVLSVAALENTGALASYSNYGASTVDLGAPGSGIISTVPGGYASFSGTSMATPHVTGAAALYLQGNPGATPATVQSAIVSAATAGVVQDAQHVVDQLHVAHARDGARDRGARSGRAVREQPLDVADAEGLRHWDLLNRLPDAKRAFLTERKQGAGCRAWRFHWGGQGPGWPRRRPRD